MMVSGKCNVHRTRLTALVLGLRSELLVAYENGHTIRTTSVHPAFHDTPMINKFRTAVRKSGLALHPPENVSRKIVEQVLKGRSGKLYMPESQYYVSFLKMLPVWFSDMLLGHIKRSRHVGRGHVERKAY